MGKKFKVEWTATLVSQVDADDYDAEEGDEVNEDLIHDTEIDQADLVLSEAASNGELRVTIKVTPL